MDSGPAVLVTGAAGYVGHRCVAALTERRRLRVPRRQPRVARRGGPAPGNDDFAYARHKRLVEAMLARYREDHPELRHVVFRPGTIVGTDVHSPVTDLLEKPVGLGIAGSSAPCSRTPSAPTTRPATALSRDARSPASWASRTSRSRHRWWGGVLWVLRRLGITDHGPEGVASIRARRVSPLGV